MTCIVGMEHDGRVWMGCDSAAVGNYTVYPTRLRKVVRVGDMLIGYTSSFRMGQLLEYRLRLPPHDHGVDDLEYLATDFIDAVRACLIEGGFATKEDEAERGGSFLVGYNGRLYQVDNDYHVNSCERGYMAVGSGMEVALGAMHYEMSSGTPLYPLKILRNALQAASDWTPYVEPPFRFFWQPDEDLQVVRTREIYAQR